LFLAQAVGAAGRIVLAALSDRTPASRFRLLTVSMIAIAAGVLVLIALPSRTPEPALALIALWLGFFGLGWYGPWVAYLAETAPADQVGLTLGAAMALNQFGIIAAPPLLGLIHDITGGYAAVWGAIAGVLAVAYVLTGLAGVARKTAK
jgi:MFS family permease